MCVYTCSETTVTRRSGKKKKEKFCFVLGVMSDDEKIENLSFFNFLFLWVFPLSLFSQGEEGPFLNWLPVITAICSGFFFIGDGRRNCIYSANSPEVWEIHRESVNATRRKVHARQLYCLRAVQFWGCCERGKQRRCVSSVQNNKTIVHKVHLASECWRTNNQCVQSSAGRGKNPFHGHS